MPAVISRTSPRELGRTRDLGARLGDGISEIPSAERLDEAAPTTAGTLCRRYLHLSGMGLAIGGIMVAAIASPFDVFSEGGCCSVAQIHGGVGIAVMLLGTIHPLAKCCCCVPSKLRPGEQPTKRHLRWEAWRRCTLGASLGLAAANVVLGINLESLPPGQRTAFAACSVVAAVALLGLTACACADRRRQRRAPVSTVRTPPHRLRALSGVEPIDSDLYRV